MGRLRGEAIRDELLSSLRFLSVPSATGTENLLMERLEEVLIDLGFKVRRQPLRDDLNRRFNLIAVRGEPELLIATHVDTVPQWGHIAGSSMLVKDDEVFMRGAVDTKGQIASLLTALKSTSEAVGVALFADEERDGKGSETFALEGPMGLFQLSSLTGAIVLEPSQLRVATSQWGNLELEVWVGGEEAHGASLSGDNALLKMLKVLDELSLLAKQLNLKLHVGKLEGGVDPQLVPDLAFSIVDLLIPPSSCQSVAYEEITAKVLGLLREMGAQWRIISADPPLKFKDTSKLLKRLKLAYERTGLQLQEIEYTAWTDAHHLHEMGLPVVILGAGELRVAHTRTESVDLNQLSLLTHLLISLIEQRGE